MAEVGGSIPSRAYQSVTAVSAGGWKACFRRRGGHLAAAARSDPAPGYPISPSSPQARTSHAIKLAPTHAEIASRSDQRLAGASAAPIISTSSFREMFFGVYAPSGIGYSAMSPRLRVSLTFVNGFLMPRPDEAGGAGGRSE